MHRLLITKWKNNTLPDRARGIFLSTSKLYPASCLMKEECYLRDKKTACAYRRGLLWGLGQREPRGSPHCLPTSMSGGETLRSCRFIGLCRIGTHFNYVYIPCLCNFFYLMPQKDMRMSSSLNVPKYRDFHFLWELWWLVFSLLILTASTKNIKKTTCFSLWKGIFISATLA